MFKNLSKISYIAYANIFIIVTLEILHSRIMSISDTLLFIILIVYGFLNGWYIQKIVKRQKKFEVNLASEKDFSKKILETSSSGILILNKDGKFIFANPALFNILNLNSLKKPLSINDTAIITAFYKRILSMGEGINGRSVSEEFIINEMVKYLKIDVVNYIHFNNEECLLFNLEDVTELIELNKKIENQYLNMFKSFVKFIDAKDTYTGLHSTKVSELTSKMIELINIDEKKKREIIIAANLHDIGKIGVPEEILNKKERLSEDEFIILRKHSEIGESLLSEIDGYEYISEIIRHHHERFDGNGYPDQLSGKDIPLGSRVIAIADTFDAITSDRVYQKKRSISEAISIINFEKNKQFDEELINIFNEIIKPEMF